MPHHENFNKGKFVVIALMALMLFAFQNCGAPSGSTQENSIIFENSRNFPNSEPSDPNTTTLEGNGSGYSGKATFVNYDLKNTCPGSTTTLDAEAKLILDNNNNFHIVMKDCKNIQPEPITTSATAYLEHSSDYVLFNDLVFSLQKGNGNINNEITQYFCRGTTEGDNQQTFVFDSKVHLQIAENSYLMDYELANYDNLFNLFRTESLKKTQTLVNETTETIEFTTERKISDFLSWFNSFFTGLFSNIFGMGNSNNSNDGRIVLTIEKNTLKGQVEVFNNQDQSQVKFENLECFAQ